MKVSRRGEEIQPFHVMALLARARELEAAGRDIVHMEIGEPDFATPEPIKQAAIEAIEQNHTHYTPAVGLPGLREDIAQHYRDRYGLGVDPTRVIVTPGASGALLLALGAILDPHEELLLADPGYPCNRWFACFIEADSRTIDVNEDTAYQLNLDLIKANWSAKSRAVLLASPANPTGTLIEKQEMQAIIDWVAGQGGWVVVDEIYGQLVYGREPYTAAGMGDNVVIINSFSKYYNMTGWRLGWLLAPTKLIPIIDRIAQNIFLAASTPAQYAARAAFLPETLQILEQRREIFRQRRDFLLPQLQAMGWEIPVSPDGAFYIYARSDAFANHSEQLSLQLLEEAGVAITPGIDFGQNCAASHVRFAYTTDVEQLAEGISRIREYIGRL
jgi:aspartate/methionine/tyrosine aminotransferase